MRALLGSLFPLVAHFPFPHVPSPPRARVCAAFWLRAVFVLGDNNATAFVAMATGTGNAATMSASVLNNIPCDSSGLSIVTSEQPKFLTKGPHGTRASGVLFPGTLVMRHPSNKAMDDSTSYTPGAACCPPPSDLGSLQAFQTGMASAGVSSQDADDDYKRLLAERSDVRSTAGRMTIPRTKSGEGALIVSGDAVYTASSVIEPGALLQVAFPTEAERMSVLDPNAASAQRGATGKTEQAYQDAYLCAPVLVPCTEERAVDRCLRRARGNIALVARSNPAKAAANGDSTIVGPPIYAHSALQEVRDIATTEIVHALELIELLGYTVEFSAKTDPAAAAAGGPAYNDYHAPEAARAMAGWAPLKALGLAAAIDSTTNKRFYAPAFLANRMLQALGILPKTPDGPPIVKNAGYCLAVIAANARGLNAVSADGTVTSAPPTMGAIYNAAKDVEMDPLQKGGEFFAPIKDLDAELRRATTRHRVAELNAATQAGKVYAVAKTNTVKQPGESVPIYVLPQ